VESFAVEECCDYLLYIPANATSNADAGVVAYGDGQVGPDGKRVEIGDSFIFQSDSDTNKQGFKICLSPVSNGGGAFIAGGTILLSDSSFIENK
jgi:hypothetical protein